MFENESIISNVIVGIVVKDTQKQRKGSSDEKKSSHLAEIIDNFCCRGFCFCILMQGTTNS